MLKKKNLLIKISTLLLVVAPIAAFGIQSGFILGEPKLPKKLTK